MSIGKYQRARDNLTFRDEDSDNEFVDDEEDTDEDTIQAIRSEIV